MKKGTGTLLHRSVFVRKSVAHRAFTYRDIDLLYGGADTINNPGVFLHERNALSSLGGEAGIFVADFLVLAVIRTVISSRDVRPGPVIEVESSRFFMKYSSSATYGTCNFAHPPFKSLPCIVYNW